MLVSLSKSRSLYALLNRFKLLILLIPILFPQFQPNFLPQCHRVLRKQIILDNLN